MSLSEILIQFLELLKREMIKPEPFGAWHIVSLICMLMLTAILVIFLRNISDRAMRLIVLVGWLIMVIFEVIRQLIFSLTIVDGSFVWCYNWVQFPFQFCSSPLYALPLVFLLKDCALRRGFIAFLSSFSLLAGMVVMAYPNSVFSIYSGINVQTMVHHGLQVVLGIYLFAYSRRHMRWKTFLGAIVIFGIFFVIALILNETVYNFLSKNEIAEQFNMFFISPYFYLETDLPIVTFLRNFISHRTFLRLYAVAFPIGAFIIYSAEKGIYHLFSREKHEPR